MNAFPAKTIAIICLLLAPTLSLGQRPSSSFLAKNLDIMLISTGSVQNELEITPVQGKMFEALGEDLRSQPFFGRGRSRPRSGSEISQSVSDRIVGVILEDDQRKRLAEVRYQFEGAYAIDREDFRDRVALEDEQLDAIREARTNDKVLSLTQLNKLIGEEKAKVWKKSLGKRFAFRGEISRLRDRYLEQLQENEQATER